ncbi:conserved hypothetical protein [Thermosulfidibacter takaii ABI70S6]|uniref:DUF507 family protein n=1 Tax=Thermosulfidibacter takaii (strain DSM 17441 / JCM 13301 / NBRC 103674 / ABI70S6) TaxID=1298851 RepID=A0A0S3QT59_THET7|nr:DUF507 family protein [Thermosulfidibacter takaii]BAT71522.1 conserved hypothetical protein [Thermosulfidibacter takaii ABI70S6]
MRLNNTTIKYLSQTLAQRIVKSQSVEDQDEEKIFKIIQRVITEDIEKEKQIEEEAHRLLRQHVREIEQQGISYQKMFNIIKQKLAKERGMIL